MSNFVERRKRFLQMMSIKYGFVEADFDLESAFEAGLDSAITHQFSLQEAFTSAMTAAAEHHVAQHLSFNLACYFAESASAKAPSAIALVPAELTFDWSDSITEARTPLAINIGASSVQIAMVENCNVQVFNAVELGLASQLSAFGADILFQAIAPTNITADIGSSLETSINLVPADSAQFVINQEEQLTINATVLSPSAPRVEAQLPFDLDFSASLVCIKRMRLSDYGTNLLANLSSSLGDLEYITL